MSGGALSRLGRNGAIKVRQKWRHHLHNRSKRYTQPRRMSIAVFADSSLSDWFKQFDKKRFITIENYLQDVMGISGTILMHPSLDQDIGN